MSHGFCVATPVGQSPVWQRWAWMQPTASIASRPTLTMSQPSARANRPCSGNPSPGADEDDFLFDAALGERSIHGREAELERQRDVIGEDERRGAGAALAAVDRDEVRATSGGRHAIRGVPAGRAACVSPPKHSAFGDVDELIEFVEMLATETGLPVGIKSAVGEQASGSRSRTAWRPPAAARTSSRSTAARAAPAPRR